MTPFFYDQKADGIKIYDTELKRVMAARLTKRSKLHASRKWAVSELHDFRSITKAERQKQNEAMRFMAEDLRQEMEQAQSWAAVQNLQTEQRMVAELAWVDGQISAIELRDAHDKRHHELATKTLDLIAYKTQLGLETVAGRWIKEQSEKHVPNVDARVQIAWTNVEFERLLIVEALLPATQMPDNQVNAYLVNRGHHHHEPQLLLPATKDEAEGMSSRGNSRPVSRMKSQGKESESEKAKKTSMWQREKADAKPSAGEMLGKRIEMTANRRNVLSENLAFVGQRVAAEEALVKQRVFDEPGELDGAKAAIAKASAAVSECRKGLQAIGPPSKGPKGT